ncbi:MAG: polyribonucleotide nucleotidyltransferase [Candidatus Tokpelaia sp. JSC161]|jgi:polyribonucleotide nucleotidyltransferase|nr:MAG: polyribonucleotide nucleotidyltransferase [Candidatus Tokpelaia sp. JSC161]
MFNIHKVEIEWAGRLLVLETGRVARQADGAVLATYGETVVLATVVSSREVQPEQDFFPLTVNYQERSYASGRIPGSYFRREGRSTENEILISRLIDRPIRPLFPEGYKNDTQVIVTVMQHDLENNPDIVSMIAASTALTLSGIPFMGPVGSARVGYIKDKYVLNPSLDEMSDSVLDLVVSGSRSAVLMVESEAQELTEEIMLGAVMFGHSGFQPVIDAIIKLAEVAAREPREFEREDSFVLETRMLDLLENDLREAFQIRDKKARDSILTGLEMNFKKQLISFQGDQLTDKQMTAVFQRVQSRLFRRDILDCGTRIDGRAFTSVRNILADVGMLSRTHGSSLFTRGETQAIVVVTLGTGEDEQYVDMLTGLLKESFMLHYNFPPFSVGETGRIGSPGRREIGHGKLAWRAIHPMLPSKDKFPYTIRVVSEVTESNGSSSMATVCGTSLALMDAGVPLIRPVAGIAMGLIKEGKRFAILSDILGEEDHLGDMDFKVAGTEKGITSLQMDIKIDGITEEIMQMSLDQARVGRIHLLKEMARAISASRNELAIYAPRIEIMSVPVDKIRDIIGVGGKVVREIVEQTGAKINIEDDGTVRIASGDIKSIDTAREWIRSIISEPEVGNIYAGTVVKVTDFGAFVNFFGPRDGLVHISHLAVGRVSKTSDMVKEGDRVWVKLIGFDERGKIRLSMKAVNQETGHEILKAKHSSNVKNYTNRGQKQRGKSKEGC